MTGYFVYEVTVLSNGEKYILEADTINQARNRASFLGEIAVRRLYGKEARDAKIKMLLDRKSLLGG